MDPHVENIDGLFDSIRFIPLETTANCLIGEINKIEYFDEKFFVMDWNITKTVYCFDKNGKFLYKINNLGKGPGEYISLMDFSINDHKKELSLLDIGNQKIITHELNGTNNEEVKFTLGGKKCMK